MRNFKRGDIVMVNLDPCTGSEEGGIRPVLIVQNNIGNYYSPTTIIAPLTSLKHVKSDIPTHMIIPMRGKLQKDCLALFEQIFTVDKSRILYKMGKLTNNEQRILDKKISISLGIKNKESHHV